MKRSWGIFLSVALVLLLGYSAVAAPQKTATHKTAPAARKTQWQGHIIRISKDRSSLSIRGGRSPNETFERMVMLDSATQWTKGTKNADPSEFKEGSFVIVEGNLDKKGMLHADRVDLHLPR
ncbi:MAG TPA: hypothetical protein VFU27_08415 [Terriglobales bacterium]|nr:hypothetical protein [Terriglobales bacterium]